MEKLRVYELAKQLNTTSKRLMEKLAEINIDVKNHMSLLEEEQLEKLYDHIGLRRKSAETENSQESQETKVASTTHEPRSQVRDIPHIIRKTRIVIDTKEQKPESHTGFKDKTNYRSNTRTDSNAGLRPGFVYDANRRSVDTGSVIEKRRAQDIGKGIQQSVEKKESEVQKVELKKQEIQSVVEPIKEEIVNVIDVKEKKVSTSIEHKEEQVTNVVEPKKEKTGNSIVQTKKPLDAHKRQTQQSGSTKTESQRKTTIVQDKKNDKKGQGFVGDYKSESRGSRKIGAQKQVKPIDKDETTQRSAQRSTANFKDKRSELPKTTDIITEARPRHTKSDISDIDREKKSKDTLRKSGSDKADKFNSAKFAGLKRNVSGAITDDFHIEDVYGRGGVKKQRKSMKPNKEQDKSFEKYISPKAVLTHVTIPEQLTVKELAEILKKTAGDVIKKLIAYGIMATINQVVDYDVATLVAEEYGITSEKQILVSEEDILFDDSEDKLEDLVPRPPVVVVMGHVDHGKTSLLDAIRKTNVIEHETGGITQHIGAYMVKVKNRHITFLDTPGHEAFTAMRARGAQVTDIAVLVVAADDGVMPQTVEAINHAKAANVSIIVAINKIDKPEANPDKIKQELTEYGLVSEEWGGDTIFVPVSAKFMQNIDGLLEMVLLVADVLELKANPNRQAKGTVIEARLDKNKGPLATVLVQRGTLTIGDSIVTGTTVGRIRALADDKGNKVKSAGPSTPVEVLGFPEVPEAGEIFYAITDERVAKQLAEKRRLKQREQNLVADAKISLDDLFEQIQQGKVKELNIIVKADVQGSVEAVQQALMKLSNPNVRIKIIHGGVGAITESDVKLAEVSNAIITGFNVRPSQSVLDIARNLGVDLRLYRVIYNAIEDIEAAMKGMLEPKFKEVLLGHAEIRQVFKVTGIGAVGGCYVVDGKISRNNDVRIVRDGIVVHEGKLSSLKRFKDDVKDVAQGYECGITIERFNDVKEGDVVEAFELQEVKSEV